MNRSQNYFDQSFEVITSQPDWFNFLKEVESFDFYHTYHYHSISKLDNETPVLLKYVENDIRIGLPLLVRNIPNTKYKDATSVYGYSGPVSNILLNQNFDNSKLKNLLVEYFKENNFVSNLVKNIKKIKRTNI